MTKTVVASGLLLVLALGCGEDSDDDSMGTDQPALPTDAGTDAAPGAGGTAGTSGSGTPSGGTGGGAAGQGGTGANQPGPSGTVDCPAFVDRLAECSAVAPEDLALLRERNIRTCNAWNATYRGDILFAMNACTSVSCEQRDSCLQQIVELCTLDPASEIVRMCQTLSGCALAGLETQQMCETELTRNAGGFRCLKASTFGAYANCVANIQCGPSSQTDYLRCSVMHLQ